jgi:hypothetical protein
VILAWLLGDKGKGNDCKQYTIGREKMSRLFGRGRLVLLSALIGLFGLSTESVYAIPLGDLLSGGTIIAGDKAFTNWVNLGDFSTNPVDLSKIDVTSLNDPSSNPGLLFTATGGVLSLSNQDIIDLAFGYTISTLDGIARINGSSLELGVFSFSSQDLGLISVSEDLLDASSTDILHNEVTTAANGIGQQLFDQTSFATQSRLSIETYIILAGGAEGDGVSLNSFTQRFSQVPEPGTFFLLTFGLAGLGYRQRRFQSASY